MSQVSISAQILGVGIDFSYVNCVTPKTINIDCSNAKVLGEWFLDPYLCQNGVCYAINSAAETVFAIQTVRVMQNGITFSLNGTLTDYIAKCNACCGSTPVLTPIAIPVYTPDGCICVDADGNYVFNISLAPPIYGTQEFVLELYNDGVQVGSDSTALVSPAEALAYAEANWDTYGTWTLTGDDEDTLTLTSTSFSCITIKKVMTSLDYCITPTFPMTFDSVLRDDGQGAVETYLLPNGSTIVADEEALAIVVADYFEDGELTTTVTGKLGYFGPGVPVTFNLGAVVKATWAQTDCS